MAARAKISLRDRAINKPQENKENKENANDSSVVDKPKAKVVKKSAPKKKRNTTPKKETKVDMSSVKRDSFTMPLFDYEMINELKLACAKQGIIMNKAEILRAGLHALNNLSDAQLKKTCGKVVKIKPGRPV